MRRLSLIGGISVGLTAASAFGRAQPYYVQVPVSAAALAADPSLANYNTWDLRVAVDPGDQFNVADFETSLSSGNFYSPVGGADIPIVPTTANLSYDTYVTIPGYQPGGSLPIYILGTGDLTGPGSPIPIFPRAGGQQSALNAVWGTMQNPLSDGDYQIARLTVSKNANGPIVGYIGSSLLANTAQFAAALTFVDGALLGDPSAAFPLLADANRDNQVTSTDFTAVSRHFNQANSTWAFGDFNGDGMVNALDFNAVSTNFGANVQEEPVYDDESVALGTAVPEPATLGMIAVLPVMLIGRRQRRA